jgi:hypothetical protein
MSGTNAAVGESLIVFFLMFIHELGFLAFLLAAVTSATISASLQTFGALAGSYADALLTRRLLLAQAHKDCSGRGLLC